MLPKGDLEEIFRGACPVIASYAGKDKNLVGAAGKIEAALAANDIPHDVKEYPEAYHSFMDDHTTLVPKIRITSYNVCYTKLLRLEIKRTR